MTRAGATLTVADLAVGYGDLTVARQIGFDVAPGEVLLLMGPNGAGKTTTLLTLIGALPPISGRVEFDGAELTGAVYRRARNGLAFMAGEHGVVFGLTVAENMRLARCDVEMALNHFPELRDHLSRRAGLLSGGQQKMLVLALAMSRDTSLLIADELSLGLAPAVVRRLLAAIRGAARSGKAVILVEQHASLALDHADKVAVLANGRMQLCGQVAEVRPEVDRILERGYLAAFGAT